jgi:hypothetical protein
VSPAIHTIMIVGRDRCRELLAYQDRYHSSPPAPPPRSRIGSNVDARAVLGQSIRAQDVSPSWWLADRKASSTRRTARDSLSARERRGPDCSGLDLADAVAVHQLVSDLEPTPPRGSARSPHRDGRATSRPSSAGDDTNPVGVPSMNSMPTHEFDVGPMLQRLEVGTT